MSALSYSYDVAIDSYDSDSGLEEDLLPAEEFERVLKEQVHSQQCRFVCAAQLRAAATAIIKPENVSTHGESGISQALGGAGGGDKLTADGGIDASPAPRLPIRQLRKLIDTTRIWISKLEGHKVLNSKGKHKLANHQRKLAKLESELNRRQQSECKE
jgi:hypothetical protein